MAKTIIEVKKNMNENNASVLRRFQRKIQESGIIYKVKNSRYNERAESKVKTKAAALKRITKRQTNEKLRKLGKLKVKVRGGGR